MCSPRRLIVMGVSSDCGRNLIGWRTQSDRVADGIRLGGERNPIGWRTKTDRVAGAFKGVHLSQVHQQSNIDTPLILLVQFLLAWLVHFLLWQAAKPSGDKCTPKENAEEQKQYSRWTCGYVQRLYIIIYRWLQGGALEIF